MEEIDIACASVSFSLCLCVPAKSLAPCMCSKIPVSFRKSARNHEADLAC